MTTLKMSGLKETEGFTPFVIAIEWLAGVLVKFSQDIRECHSMKEKK